MATTPNFVNSLTTFSNGVYGSGGFSIVNDMYSNFNTYGYTFYPPNGSYGMMCCSTDQDWTIVDPQRINLMENYIYRLFAYSPGGPVWIGVAPLNTQIPAGGGTLNYLAQITNGSGSTWTGDAWTNVILPNGNFLGNALMVRPNLTFPDGTVTPVYSLSQYVPSFAPAGHYQFFAFLGTYPTNVETSWHFDMYKLVIAPDDVPAEPSLNDTWHGDNWSAVANEFTEQPIETALPEQFQLGDPYPNPFNPSTTIELSLPETRNLSVVVYDVQGREVATLAQGNYHAGEHRFSFDARGLASGIYFLRAQSGSEMQTRKLMLLH